MLSTVCNPQRGSQSYIEKRRRKEIEVSRRKGVIKRRALDLGSALFPKCSPQPGIHKDIQSWVEKRRGMEEIEATWWRKRRIKRGREESSQ